MKVWILATCIVVGLIALVTTTTALDAAQINHLLSVVIFLFEEKDQAEYINKTYEQLARIPAFKLNKWKAGVKFDKLHSYAELDGVDRSGLESSDRVACMDAFSAMFGEGDYTAEMIVNILKRGDFKCEILAELLFDSIRGKVSVIQIGEYVGLLKVITGKHDLTTETPSVLKIWNEVNKDGNHEWSRKEFVDACNSTENIAKLFGLDSSIVVAAT